MYDLTNVAEKQNFKEEKKESSLKKRLAIKYFIRIASAILAFYLLTIDQSFTSKAASIFLIGTLLFENIFFE